jgi:hypothetical protein
MKDNIKIVREGQGFESYELRVMRYELLARQQIRN